MSLVIKDENLRLIYQDQEAEFLDEKYSYHRTSCLLCALGVVGLPFFFAINHHFVGTGQFVLLLLSLLWAILGLFALLNLPFALYRWIKYRQLKREHRNFLQKYNRLTK